MTLQESSGKMIYRHKEQEHKFQFQRIIEQHHLSFFVFVILDSKIFILTMVWNLKMICKNK